ncbi:hypothetical protein BRC81_09900 [Halobacteriales archaeon QS_1_68_20]|nr:MAG: hypothetical protein BRC81_09900 [Halobacteriales archaeon QS_1_68_20]
MVTSTVSICRGLLSVWKDSSPAVSGSSPTTFARKSSVEWLFSPVTSTLNDSVDDTVTVSVVWTVELPVSEYSK